MSREIKYYRLEAGNSLSSMLSPEDPAWLELDADERLELLKQTALILVFYDRHERAEAVARFGAYLELLERAQSTRLRDQKPVPAVTDLCSSSPPRSSTTGLRP